ncbi:hypothetical protein CLCR_10262 [Cladophialophora carrionii]|uniref:Rhodopsin domain-containing protein n=1 Tax=Cladophialophora carrionii TaxID=86049 RepID=A0A1C1CZA2_9EURO|nr:hypothetical protein CLCR_10262 [Cladophialophora carrionii]
MAGAAHLLLARVPVISASHKGPVVNLISWIAMTTMCLAVITVLISKLVVLRRLTWNDSILSAAMIFSIAFTLTLNQQVSGGLGSKLSTLSDDQYDRFQRAGYAWNILYIVALCLGKSSTLSLLLALSPNKSYRIPMLAVGGLIVAWAVASVIASAFQCALPHPYQITTNTCFSQVGFWDAVGVVDILTDLALMVFPIWLVYNLQLAVQKKIAVCFAFSFRTLAVACAVWRMSEMHRFFDRDTDVTFESWLPTIATILEVFFSVFSACVPHLRPFMESIQAGYLSGVIQEGDGRFGYGNDSYLMGKMAQSKAVSAIRSQALKSEIRGESLDLPRQGITLGQINDSTDRHGIGRAISSNRVVVNKVSAGKPEKDPSSERNRSDSIGSDGGRSHGSDGSKAMIIKTTKEWSISYQDV